MKELALKYGCNPNQKPSRIYQKTGLLCLHFVGVTKIFMEGIYEHQDYAFGARFYTYLLTIRGHLADIKHGNTRFQQRIKIRRAEKASKASNN